MNSKRCHNLTAASSGVLNPTANNDEKPKKETSLFQFYRYAITPIDFEGKTCLAKLVFATKNGKQWEYYDHIISEIKKEAWQRESVKNPTELPASLDIKDNTTKELLQALVDKIVKQIQ